MPMLLLLALKRAGSGLMSWLGTLSFWQIAFGAALIFAGIQTVRIKAEQRHSVKLSAQIVKCASARHADQAAYANAQADAQAKNLADVARDKAERERITNDISQSYEAELASVRADLARRLRPPAKGAPGQPGLPGVSQAPSGSDGSSRVSIPTGLYVRGAELEVQLEQLQRWVDQQSALRPNK